MSQLTKLYIADTGMITPIGVNTQMTLASLNAGISAYQDSQYMNRSYVKMKTAVIPTDAIEIPEVESDKILAKQARYKRMLGIASTALTEVFEQYTEEAPLPLFLGGPESTLSKTTAIDSDFIKHLADISGANLDVKRSRLFATGRTSVLEAIDLAFSYIEQTEANHVLVGGVDSFIDPYVLAGLEMELRVLSSNNSDGFAPSEGAAFLLLTKQKSTFNAQDNTAAMLTRPCFADEAGHRYSDEPYRGDGLATATTKALAAINNAKVTNLISSMNGESFSAKELGVTMLRNSKKLAENLNIEHPADCVGDTGAAVGAILIAIAASKSNQLSVVCSSADKASRAVCAVQSIK